MADNAHLLAVWSGIALCYRARQRPWHGHQGHSGLGHVPISLKRPINWIVCSWVCGLSTAYRANLSFPNWFSMLYLQWACYVLIINGINLVLWWNITQSITAQIPGSAYWTRTIANSAASRVRSWKRLILYWPWFLLWFSYFHQLFGF